MPLILSSVTAPDAKEALLLSQVKKDLNVDHEDDDDYIAELIKTALATAENKTWRALLSQTWDYYLTTFPSGDHVIEIPKPPLVSITSIKYQDADDAQQTWDSSEYVVDTDSEPGRVYLATDASWPAAYFKRKAIVIRFVAGYSAIPEPVKKWMMIWITDAYDVMRQSYFQGGGFAGQIIKDRTFADNLIASYKVHQW